MLYPNETIIFGAVYATGRNNRSYASVWSGAALHLDGVWFIEIQCQAQCQARRHVIQEHLKHIGRFCGPNGNLVG